jgi:hypothetical protein
MNETFANWTDGTFAHYSGFNYSHALPWLVSRLRIFLYLSDPREESFKSVHDVADYHTEVSGRWLSLPAWHTANPNL